MNKFFRLSFLSAAIFSAVVLVSCNSEDPPLPDNTIQFQSSTQGLGASQSEIDVTITFVRALQTAGNVTLSFAATGLTYGNDFITDPVVDASNKIVIPVAAGAESATFKVTKTNTTGLQGDEKVDFTIESAPAELVIGSQKAFTLSFAEIIATSAEMEIAGGGATYPNKVFIDLSGNTQTSVARTTWDFAFSSKADEFRVLLNSANGMLARKLEKNDLTEVTAADTTDWGKQLGVNDIFNAINTYKVNEYPEWLYESISWMDNNTGDLTKTAIAEINVDADENLVYIVNRGTGPNNTALGWSKIRVVRNGSNYDLQYADISSATFTTLTITKNTATRFNYVSLTTGGVVAVEPATWDIAWSGFLNQTPTADETGVGPIVPYYFQDIVLTNINGGAAAFAYTTGDAGVSGVTGQKTYDDFTAADLSVITNYSTSQLAIGSGWRIGGGPGSAPAVNASRFYIVKDAQGNVYKVKFTSLTKDGERGKPSLKFELLTKAS